MWICTRCATHQKAEPATCPRCGATEAMRPLGQPGTAEPAPPEQIPARPAPDLQTPWTRQGVELGLYVGVGLPLLMGVLRLINGSWAGGLLLILGSPLIGLVAAVVFAYLVTLLEDLWYQVAGPSGSNGVWAFRIALALMLLGGALLGVAAADTDIVPPPLQGALRGALMSVLVLALCVLPMYAFWRKTRAPSAPGLGEPDEEPGHLDHQVLPGSSSTDIVAGREDLRSLS